MNWATIFIMGLSCGMIGSILAADDSPGAFWEMLGAALLFALLGVIFATTLDLYWQIR